MKLSAGLRTTGLFFHEHRSDGEKEAAFHISTLLGGRRAGGVAVGVGEVGGGVTLLRVASCLAVHLDSVSDGTRRVNGRYIYIKKNICSSSSCVARAAAAWLHVACRRGPFARRHQPPSPLDKCLVSSLSK